MKLVFDVEPQQQERPRFARRGNFVSVYDPPNTKAFKRHLSDLAKFAMRDKAKFLEAISVDISFYRPVLKSFSKAKIERAEQGLELPITRPDVDNYVKATLDALNGIVWSDDNLIVDLSAHKRFSVRPRIEVRIKKIEV